MDNLSTMTSWLITSCLFFKSSSNAGPLALFHCSNTYITTMRFFVKSRNNYKMKLFSFLLVAVWAKHCNPTIPAGGNAAPANVDPQPGYKRCNVFNICYILIWKIWVDYHFSNGLAIRMYQRRWNTRSARKMWLFLPMWSFWSQMGHASKSWTLLGCRNWRSELDQFDQLRQRSKSTMWARSWTMAKWKQSWSSSVWLYRMWRKWHHCCLWTAMTC